MRFSDLTGGDRFLYATCLWTKLDADTARKHGTPSLLLTDKGYGYVGDSVCSFECDDEVTFVPPISVIIPKTAEEQIPLISVSEPSNNESGLPADLERLRIAAGIELESSFESGSGLFRVGTEEFAKLVHLAKINDNLP